MGAGLRVRGLKHLSGGSIDERDSVIAVKSDDAAGDGPEDVVHQQLGACGTLEQTRVLDGYGGVVDEIRQQEHVALRERILGLAAGEAEQADHAILSLDRHVESGP